MADHNIILLKHKQNLQENGCIITKKNPKNKHLPKAHNNKLEEANQMTGWRGQRGNVNPVALFLDYIYLYIHALAPNTWYSQGCQETTDETLK